MVMLQEELRAKEDLRLQGIRDRAQERTIRFMNSRERTIGVDKKILDLQVEEKRMKKLAEKEADREEAACIEQLCHLIEQEETYSLEQKQCEINELKETLLEQMKAPKNNAIKMDGPLDVEECGSSSAQHFYGEDSKFEERTKLHQKQIREWSSKQIKEMIEKVAQDEEEQKKYAEFVQEEDNLRSILEEKEAKYNYDVLKSVQMDNLKRADDTRNKREHENKMDKKQKADEVKYAISDPFLTEETDFSKSKFRPDLFKGFSKDQIKYIFQENDAVLREKAMLRKRAQDERENWDAYQADIVYEMEKSEYERKLKVRHDNQLQAETLKIQRKELKEKQDRMIKDKFGAVEEGFFQKFGRSCR